MEYGDLDFRVSQSPLQSGGMGIEEAFVKNTVSWLHPTDYFSLVG